MNVGVIHCTLINSTSYPSTTDPTQPYEVTYIYKSEIPVNLDPNNRIIEFMFDTTNPVSSDAGFQDFYPMGAGRLYVSNSADGP